MIDLKLVAYVGIEIEDRNLELTCLTLGKGDWKTVNYHLSIVVYYPEFGQCYPSQPFVVLTVD